MEKCNTTSRNTENGRNMMNMMERFERFLDKVINAHSWETSAELHRQRIIEGYGLHQIKIVDNHYEKEITGVLTTTEPDIEDMDLTEIKPIAIEDAEQTPKVTTLV